MLKDTNNQVSATLYAYTYNEKIIYAKLQANIKETHKRNYEPNRHSHTRKKNENHRFIQKPSPIGKPLSVISYDPPCCKS